MSQAIQEIPNSSGHAFRQAVIAVTKALASMYSGTVDPATLTGFTSASQLWLDTANNLTKQLNSTGTTWIPKGTIDSNGTIVWYPTFLNNSFSGDFHSQTTQGTFVTSAIAQTNAPNATDLFWLYVIVDGTNILHFAVSISSGQIYTEYYNGTTWSSAWSSPLTTASLLATNITSTAENLVTATNVQNAILQLSQASYIASTATGNVTATNVQSAIAQLAVMPLWHPSTVVVVGQIAYSSNLPSWARLECVTAGVTAATEPTWGTTAGVLVTDGTATWIIDDMRDGLSVGSLDYSHILKTGRIKANGALISRAAYPRLYKFVNDNALATTEALWASSYSGLFSVGDGSTTFRVPDLRGKFLQGADTAGAAIAAGLPNITGDFPVSNSSASPSGAFYIESYFTGNGQDSQQNKMIALNAARSSAVYGNSTTVQPPAIAMIPQIKY